MRRGSRNRTESQLCHKLCQADTPTGTRTRSPARDRPSKPLKTWTRNIGRERAILVNELMKYL
jgi:hypothetical protein